MKGFFAGLIGFVIVIGLLVIAYVTQATWKGRARDTIQAYESMDAAMYEGPADKAPQPTFSVRNGDVVWVLWDFDERGRRICLMQMPDGRRGWGSCKTLKPVEAARPSP